jgi:hypothetical protein
LTGISRICLCLPARAIISCSSGMYSTWKKLGTCWSLKSFHLSYDKRFVCKVKKLRAW